MKGKSTRIPKPDRRTLRIEELEERIAPVIVTSDPGTWIIGDTEGDPPTGPFNGWDPSDPSSNDAYWIFYFGPGQADIRAADGSTDINLQHIGNITITGCDDTSMLFILDMPNDATPNQDLVPWDTDTGTIWVQGNITTDGPMGAVVIDGLLGEFLQPQPTMTVAGNMGKLEVGLLTSNVFVQDDLWVLDSDTTIGSVYVVNVEIPFFYHTTTTISAAGNIGTIRAGLGLTEGGGVLGGSISGTATIRANSDSVGEPGIIDLIEARAGGLIDGSLGDPDFQAVPTISAGPGGNVRFIHFDSQALYGITELSINSETPIAQRTIVDDSGGVMVINPLDVTFESGTDITTYLGQAAFTLVPVDRATQGPGAVLARVGVSGDVSFSVTGNVEVGEISVEGFTEYPEGLALDFADPDGPQNIDSLFIEDFETITELEGYAQLTFGGPGEADIYFINAASDIPVVLNNTEDGDIVSASAPGNVILISASNRGGDIGATETITPFLLKTPLYYSDGDVGLVDANPDPAVEEMVVWEGSLAARNSIYGIFAEGTVHGAKAGGAIGDIRTISGSIRRVVANTNGVRDPGSPIVNADVTLIDPDDLPDDPFIMDVEFSIFGKIHNSVGDGVFGQILSGSAAGSLPRDSHIDTPEFPWSGGGVIEYVNVGEGLEPTTVGTQLFVSSGVYTASAVGTVVCHGGSGLFGDIVGKFNGPFDPDLPEDDPSQFPAGVNRVIVSGGAVIDGIFIVGGDLDARFSAITVTADVGIVRAVGPGAVINDTSVIANGITSIAAVGGSNGITNTWGFSFNGGLGSVIADGPGIDNCTFESTGPIGAVRTLGPDADISNTVISTYYTLGVLSTNALLNDDIEATTIGSMSTLDTIQNTDLRGGGLRRIIVRNDVTNSLIAVAGPLDLLKVGGGVLNSTIEATGPFGDVGRILVTGDITNSQITSEHDITMVQSRTGSIINTDIIARASGDLDAFLVMTRFANVARIQAAGDISGSITIGSLEQAELGSQGADLFARVGIIKAGGDISCDITIGGADWTGDILADIDIRAWIGSIMAGGNITGVIRVGEVTTTAGGLEAGDITGNLDINATLARVRAGGSISGGINVGIVDAANDINGDVTINAGLNSVIADGGVSGDINVGILTAAGDINGVVNVPETVGVIRVGGALSGDVLVGAVTSAGAINNDVTFRARLGAIRADGDISGAVRVGNENAGGGVAGAVGGTGTVGSLISGGGVTGDIAIRSDLSAIRADGDVGNDGGVLHVGGRLGSIVAGGRDTVGNILSDVTVIGNAGRISATGAFPGSLDVGGNLGRLSTVGDAGEATDTIQIGGRLGILSVGDRDTFSDLLASVTVGGNVGSLTVTGDVENTVDSGLNIGRIVVGRIFSDITVANNVNYIKTGSGINVISPTELQFINPGFPTGSLTVGGRIGIIA